MRKQKKIAVIIPALNEEKSLPKVINEIPEFVDKIIVVDNNSHLIGIISTMDVIGIFADSASDA